MKIFKHILFVSFLFLFFLTIQSCSDEEENDSLEAIQQTLALLKRTLVVWLAIIAILTLTGWVL